MLHYHIQAFFQFSLGRHHVDIIGPHRIDLASIFTNSARGLLIFAR